MVGSLPITSIALKRTTQEDRIMVGRPFDCAQGFMKNTAKMAVPHTYNGANPDLTRLG